MSLILQNMSKHVTIYIYMCMFFFPDGVRMRFSTLDFQDFCDFCERYQNYEREASDGR